MTLIEFIKIMKPTLEGMGIAKDVPNRDELIEAKNNLDFIEKQIYGSNALFRCINRWFTVNLVDNDGKYQFQLIDPNNTIVCGVAISKEEYENIKALKEGSMLWLK